MVIWSVDDAAADMDDEDHDNDIFHYGWIHKINLNILSVKMKKMWNEIWTKHKKWAKDKKLKIQLKNNP